MNLPECTTPPPSRHLQAQHTRGAARDCSVLVLRIGAPQGMLIRIRTYFVAISLVRERAPARAHLLPGPPPHLVSIQPSAATEARVHQPGGHSHMPCPSRIKLAHTHMSCPHPHGLPANTPALTEVRRDAATYEEKEKEEQQQEVVCLQLCPFRRRVLPTPRPGRTCAKEVIDGANVLASHLRVLRSKAASQASAHTGAGERPSGRPRCGLRVGALCALPCHATHVIN